VSPSRPEHRQLAHRIRLEWGAPGLELLATDCAAVIIVDVLSFSTSVDIAVSRGASVLPQPSADLAAAAREARARGALPAGPRAGAGPSLRPSSLLELAPGTRLALPSPNGATLCEAATGRGVRVFAGCLRNASAVAAAALRVGGPIGLVPAGERWPDASLRVATEDLIGAGAIAAALPPTDRSAEAELAACQFATARERGLDAVLAAVGSGQELIADGYAQDIRLAAAHNVSPHAPCLRDGLLTDF
jgi:2-phosphosulfolactate phosphatase